MKRLIGFSMMVIASLAFAAEAGLKDASNWYFNATMDGLALGGYDVVAYFTLAEAREGEEAFSAQHGGLTYRFISAEHRDRFRAEPARYLPQYGGWCAYGCTLRVENGGWAAARYPVDPKAFAVIDDKLYLFNKSQAFDAQAAWNDRDQTEQIALADAWWAEHVTLAERGLPDGMDPRAPLETARFAFFIGKWKNEVRWMNDLEKKTYGPSFEGIWHARFAWDGFAINDDWKQVGVPGSGGPGWRYVDRRSGKWVMLYLPIGQGAERIWTMEGVFNEKGEMVGRLEGKDPQGRDFLQRVHFYDIKPNSFQWRADRSYDGGETWIEAIATATNTRIEL